MKSHRLFPILTLLLVCASTALVSSDDATRIVSSSTSGKEVRRFEVTGPWGGDVRALVASPSDADLLYLGTADGQIFRSNDGARTWKRLKPGLDKRGLSVDHIVIDPRDPKTLYAGAWAVERDQEGGVFRSNDGGEHWKQLEGTKKLSVRSVAVAPSDSNVLIAGSANDDPNLNGVFRSTDAGKSWERISPIGDKEIRNIESVAIDPRDTNVIYAGTWHLPWKTTNGGATWKQIGNQIAGMINDSDVFGITVDPKQPSTVYVNACSGFYRSLNSGEKWFKFPGIPFSARRTYTLLVHPSNPKVIFAGTSEGLWRSKDDGKRWMLLTSKTLVIRSIVVTPDKPNRVLIATDDFGVRVSENLGDDFSDSNTGFIHRHVLAIMPDAAERGRLLASVFHDGSGGSVFASSDGGESWRSSSTGLGGRDVFSFYQIPANPNVIYAGTNSGVYRSNDRGATWAVTGVSQIKKPEKSAKPPARTTRPRRRAGVTWSPTQVGRYETVAVSKRTPNQKSQKPAQKRPAKKEKPKPKTETGLAPGFVELTREVGDITSFTNGEGHVGLLAATMDGLYRTFDESRGWEKVSIDGYESGGRVFSVSTHKDTPRKILAGTKQGLFISNDSGETWQHVDRGPSDMSVKAIAQDPRDAQLVIVGTNQYIFRSTNGGRTWVRRGGGLPSGDFTSVVMSPTNPDEVMAAEYSKGGVFRSTDKGYNWERVDVELPSNRVWTLIFDPFERDRVYLGSFSSGVYVFTIQQRANTTGQQ
ncbi:MAG: YCF48-related protein [Acidobacteriota bacterium]